ncbi:MAG: DUF3526 domain-containing protein [Pseudomonadota bacterium]
MTLGTHFTRELWFLWRDKTAVFALIGLCALSVFSAVNGLDKMASQRSAIAAMVDADAADRQTAQSKVRSFGDAGYYSFYITYDPPSPLAFAAFGQRTTAPYMKRVRLLALEGQIYQGDSPNPLLAHVGSLDLAFIAAFAMPLVLIVLLHDLKSSETAGGRLTLLQSLPGTTAHFWAARVLWRSVLAFASVALPFTVAAAVSGAAMGTVLSALLAIAATAALWAAVSVLAAQLSWPSSTIAASLVGLWLALNVLVPVGAHMAVMSGVHGPDGSDVALLQREAVNDAWDIPKEDTLGPFAALYPQFTIDEELNSFDWRWYFAFQTMGDVTASDLSNAYRQATRQRDNLLASARWLSPGLALQRHLEHLAKTDLRAQLAYDSAIRAYHDALKAFFFPLIFGKAPFDPAALAKYPAYEPPQS